MFRYVTGKDGVINEIISVHISIYLDPQCFSHLCNCKIKQ